MNLSNFFLNFSKGCVITGIKWKAWRTYATLSYIHNVGKEPLKALTIGNLLKITTNKYPDRVAVISRFQKQKITYQEVLKQADKLAAGLQTLGLKKGDRFGIWAPNIAEWVIIQMASVRAGFISVALNPGYQVKEIEYCINKIGMKALICPYTVQKINFYNILNELSPKLQQSKPGILKSENIPSLTTIVVISNEALKGTYNYNEVLELADNRCIENIRNNQHLIQPDDPCSIQFTSGTTGQPKAAVASHFQIVNNSFQIGKRVELDKVHHKICVQVPLFHAFGMTGAIGAALNFGATMVLPSPTYSPLDNLNTITEEGCTVVYGTPTMYVDLVNVQKEQQTDVNAKIAVSGGAPCSPELFKQIKEHLKVNKVKSIYGLTEATAAAFHSLPIDENEYQATATVGHIGEHLEVKVVDNNNYLVPMGTPGELCIRGYSTMLGYWKDEDKTKEIIGSDGWLKTGDQFVLQENGYGKIVGRLKDMIVRGGENIFPKEIEDLLNKHPDVLESHVIGLTHERLGEEVCACIRLKEGAQLTHESLVKFCKGKIANFKIPSQLKIMKSYPKTASGKVQKVLLKKQFEESSN